MASLLLSRVKADPDAVVLLMIRTRVAFLFYLSAGYMAAVRFIFFFLSFFLLLATGRSVVIMDSVHASSISGLTAPGAVAWYCC